MKKLDLNALERPTLDLTLRDEKRTEVHLVLDSTKLVEKLLAVAPELSEVSKNPSVQSINALYGLAADLISMNTEGKVFTATEIREEYGVRLEDIIIIFSTYLEFVSEIQNAKN